MQQYSCGIESKHSCIKWKAFDSTRQEELAASQAALDAALAEGRQQRQLLQQREAEAVELARAVEDARRGVAQVCACRGSGAVAYAEMCLSYFADAGAHQLRH